MLSAYLGGRTVEIIKPDYEHGLRSLLREYFLVDAHARVVAAKLQQFQLQYEAQYAPLIPPDKAIEILRKRSARLQFLQRLQSMDLLAKEPALLGVQNLLTLYNALHKAGIIQDLVDDDEETAPDNEEVTA